MVIAQLYKTHCVSPPRIITGRDIFQYIVSLTGAFTSTVGSGATSISCEASKTSVVIKIQQWRLPGDTQQVPPATAATSSTQQTGPQEGATDLSSSVDTAASGSYNVVGTGATPPYRTESNVVAEVIRLSSIIEILVSRVAALPPLQGGVGAAPPAQLVVEDKQAETGKLMTTEERRLLDKDNLNVYYSVPGHGLMVS